MNTKIKTGLKGLLLIIVLFVAIVMIINTSPFDEELNPEVKKLMQPIPIPEVEGNAYYAIYGINADKDKDIIQAGHELILRYIENRKKGNDALNPKDYDEILGKTRPTSSMYKAILNSKGCETGQYNNCLSNLSDLITPESMKNSNLLMMLKRYDKIIEMEKYSSFLDLSLSTPLIRYNVMKYLNSTKIANTYNKENRQEFIEILHKDLMFWKMVLNQGLLLVDKMVAFDSIRKNTYYLSEYMRNNPISESDHQLISEMLVPLTANELDLSQSFITESRSFLHLASNIESTSSWYENLLIQPNATINKFHNKQVKDLIQLAKLPIEGLIKLRNTQNPISDNLFKFNYLYNYFGKTLTDYSLVAYTDYIVRGYDINNIIKMVNIQYQTIMSKKSIKEVLNKPKNYNSYTNKPFDYSTSEQMLAFECLEKHSTCKIKL